MEEITGYHQDTNSSQQSACLGTVETEADPVHHSSKSSWSSRSAELIKCEDAGKRCKPADSGTRKIKPVFEMKEFIFCSGIEIGRQVQQKDTTYFRFLHGSDYVIGNGNYCSFSGMELLDSQIQLLRQKVTAEAICNYLFQDLLH